MTETSSAREPFAPLHLNVLLCMGDGNTWTSTTLTTALDPGADNPTSLAGFRTLIAAALAHLRGSGHVAQIGEDQWRLTPAGREAHARVTGH